MPRVKGRRVFRESGRVLSLLPPRSQSPLGNVWVLVSFPNSVWERFGLGKLRFRGAARVVDRSPGVQYAKQSFARIVPKRSLGTSGGGVPKLRLGTSGGGRCFLVPKLRLGTFWIGKLR